jgi:hypothetical protein
VLAHKKSKEYTENPESYMRIVLLKRVFDLSGDRLVPIKMKRHGAEGQFDAVVLSR